MGQRIDTRAIGLDAGLGFVRWLTGAENLHYGLWTDLAANAANLGAAQAAYTEKLFGYLPERPLSILDIGGGAGETARKLAALGHEVEIVVPSPLLAERCRANLPEGEVHETTFETFQTDRRFDLCLFSESFQYIPLATGLDKALSVLNPGGRILIADCFRSEGFAPTGPTRIAGGGHPIAAFRAALANRALDILREEDITSAVAPSIDLEQELFHVFGHAIDRIDIELADKRPLSRWTVAFLLRRVLGRRRLTRLNARLRGTERTAEVFETNNRYLMILLGKTGD